MSDLPFKLVPLPAEEPTYQIPENSEKFRCMMRVDQGFSEKCGPSIIDRRKQGGADYIPFVPELQAGNGQITPIMNERSPDPVTGETSMLPVVTQVSQTDAPSVAPMQAAQGSKLPLYIVAGLAALYFLRK